VTVGGQGSDESFEGREDIVKGGVEVRVFELDVGHDCG
jgi:hypothetical protein